MVLHLGFFAHNSASAVGYHDGTYSDVTLFNILHSEAETYCISLMVY